MYYNVCAQIPALLERRMKKYFPFLACIFIGITTHLHAASLPFSPSQRVNNMLYLSGQVGIVKPGQLVQGGISAETKQAMENIKRILAQNGSSMDHIVKCTVMMIDMSEYSAMNSVYSTYFAENKYPTRSVFGTTGLVLGARVEIECLATV